MRANRDVRTTSHTGGRPVCFALALLALLGAGAARANDIAVTNVVWENADGGSAVRFDLRWQNSWRARLVELATNTVTGTAQTNENWDAAWVFLKHRPSGSSNAWQHGTLSAQAGDHAMPAGAACSVGLTGGKGVGVFVYRDAVGNGNAVFTNIQLRWRHTLDNVSSATPMDIQVHAIEMVYVARGAFNAGSGGTEPSAFTSTVIATNDATQTGGYPTGQTAPANAAWPNGFDAFYCMKYEVTQGQYASFLNALSSSDATARYPGQAGNNRHTVVFTNNAYYMAARPDRVCNHLSYADSVSYLAWTGLRLMTELEFEKACRGPRKPVANENAWGTATVMSADKTLSGAENGTEIITTSTASGAAHWGFLVMVNADGGGYGPLRAGIFATPNSTRITSGASYWGLMEMSGSMWERAVTIGNEQGRAFQGTHGDGTLILPADWPAAGTSLGSGLRAGDWVNAAGYLQVSRRDLAMYTDTSRGFNFGVRGVRTAP